MRKSSCAIPYPPCLDSRQRGLQCISGESLVFCQAKKRFSIRARHQQLVTGRSLRKGPMNLMKTCVLNRSRCERALVRTVSPLRSRMLNALCDGPAMLGVPNNAMAAQPAGPTFPTSPTDEGGKKYWR